ncbi:hypothetical protein [Thermococcus sp. 21S9]|uniref:hypothetical protein n=1 Tax=Thermococcus sp. 21S9 TaxID=1638223 RepID=UPI00143C356D|nr:hypothetical protein [Thermococcus sp. 21S9]NJE54094.1 hypothetical protein [Thermococcus sp. 21S9]
MAFGFEEILEEILKEGLFWAAWGRPSEVMPFLRGKLLGNGLNEKSKRQLEWLLDELEEFYKRVACCGRVEEKHVRAVKSFHRDIVSVIETDGA